MVAVSLKKKNTREIKKEKILTAISENLTAFNKEYEHKFLCPTCLALIDLNEISQISEAHIIPKSTGNNKITWLCSECNKIFGHKQDKWFGEYINIVKEKTSNATYAVNGTTSRVMIKQSGDITKTETSVDITITGATSSNTFYNTPYNLPFHYTANNWNGVTGIYSECVLKTSNALYTAYGICWNQNVDSRVTGSKVTTTSTTRVRVRSADISVNLIYGHDYIFATKISNASGTVTLYHGRLVFQQSNFTKSETLLIIHAFKQIMLTTSYVAIMSYCQ